MGILGRMKCFLFIDVSKLNRNVKRRCLLLSLKRKIAVFRANVKYFLLEKSELGHVTIQEMPYISAHSAYLFWRQHSHSLPFWLVPTPDPAHYRQASVDSREVCIADSDSSGMGH